MRISDWSSDVCSSDLSGLQCVDQVAIVRRRHAATLSPPLLVRFKTSLLLAGIGQLMKAVRQLQSLPEQLKTLRDRRITIPHTRQCRLRRGKVVDECRRTATELRPADMRHPQVKPEIAIVELIVSEMFRFMPAPVFQP